jgi:hypothetical protein
VNSLNTVGELSPYDVTSISSVIDDNFSSTIVGLFPLVNGGTAGSCGLNDVLTIDAIVNRNDGSSGSVYDYQFNIGDQIILSITWFGCNSAGDTPVIIASSNEITITQNTYNAFKGGYVFAHTYVQRGLTIGDVQSTGQIYIN